MTITVNANLDHLADVSLISSHSFVPFPHCTVWKEVSMYSPRLRSGEPDSPLRGACLHKPPGIFLHWSLSLLPHLFVLFNNSIKYVINCWIIYLFKYRLTNIYFILWVIIQYNYIYFLAQIVPALVLELFQLARVSLWHTPVYFFLSTFLLSGTTRCSSFILCYFLPPVLGAAIIPWSPSSFYWKVVLEMKV